MTNETEQEHSDHSVQKLSAISVAVFIAEFAVIVIINAFTIVAFKRNRHLRKRSTYLITNLTVADLLVGAITGPLEFYYLGVKTWNWQGLIMVILSEIFPFASLTNLSLISLDRLHATVYPFRHCLTGKWFSDLKIIFFSWLLALPVSSTNVILSLYIHSAGSGLLMSFLFLTLLIVTVSNIIITTKIKHNPLPHPSRAVASERKLSVTLLIVSVASMLTILPWVVFQGLDTQSAQLSNYATIQHVFFYMNSIVNPLIYAIRMQEFRKAVKELVCKNNSGSAGVEPIELHVM